MNSNIKNIIVLINSLAQGGAELQAIELANLLNEKYFIHLVALNKKNSSNELLKKINKNISLTLFSGNKLKIGIELYQFLKKNKIDCIYSFLATSNVYAVIIGKLCGVHCVIMNFCSSNYSGFKLIIQRFLHNRFATCSIVNSFKGEEFLVNNGCRKEKLKVIHNIFTPNSNNFVKGKNNIPCIITIARFVYEKDYDTALLAIRRIKDVYKSFTFKYIIIGYGVLEDYIKNKIKSYQLDEYVTIVVNPNNIENYLINADIYLCTSLVEGTSNAILEAMYAELPIVATNVGDNMFLLSQGNGFITEVKNDLEISEKLIKLLFDNEIRIEMGKRSKQFILENFNKDYLKNKHYEILNNIVKL